MKKIIILFVVMFSIKAFGDVSAIEFYVFDNSDFKHSVLGGKKIEELTEDALKKSIKIRFQGMILTFPVSIRFSNGAMYYKIKFSRSIFAPEEKNVIDYDIYINSKTVNKNAKILGSVKMQGKDKLSINTDWEKSEFVVILISRNLKK